MLEPNQIIVQLNLDLALRSEYINDGRTKMAEEVPPFLVFLRRCLALRASRFLRREVYILGALVLNEGSVKVAKWIIVGSDK